ncbi:MAG: glycosyltransferase [Candidatus Shapirobacteria bacterium]
MKNSSPKIAIFYDWLNQWGGAEKVLLNLLKIYPKAPVFTLFHDPSKTNWLPPTTTVISSFIQKLPFHRSNPVFYTPIYPLALEQFDFSQYDIVISTTSTVGHCLLTLPNTMFICHLHTPNRHLYQKPPSILKPILKKYQKIDRIYSKRPDFYTTNCLTTQARIQKNYHRPSTIIYPGINLDRFKPSSSNRLSDKYFLTVSRLVPYKKVEIAIKSCIKLNLILKIVGTGRTERYLKNKYSQFKNIQFLGLISDSTLIALYQNCQALICPQKEDFGLTPLEVQACGRPVIAYRRGGITETVIDQKTGLFFNHQTTFSLIKTLNKFHHFKFDSDTCVQNASRFSENNFMLNFKNTVNNLWHQFQTTTF